MLRFKTGDSSGLCRIGLACSASPPAHQQFPAVLQMPEKPTAPVANTFARPEIKELTETAPESPVRRRHSHIHHMSAINPILMNNLKRVAWVQSLEPPSSALTEKVRRAIWGTGGRIIR